MLHKSTTFYIKNNKDKTKYDKFYIIPSSTTSPTNTFAIPAIAMTTFGDIAVPVIDCIN